MSSLAHHGVKGQKWGVRRYQNPDGTRTQAGKRRDLEARRTRRATKSKAIVDSIIASMNDDDWVVYEHQSPKQKQFNDATKQVLSKTSTNVKSITKEPADIHGVMDRARCSEKDARTCINLADRIYEKAASVEPRITQDIIGIVNNSNSSMYGLEHRLKQPTSMAGKIGSDSKSDSVSFVEAANGIKDAVRYTTVSDNKSFVSDYRQLKSGLESKGYEEVKCKNFFEKYRAGEVQHKAVQTTFKSPNGYEFELQFQTPESQAAKDLKIPIYEERRKQGISSSRAKELEKQMHDLAERVPYPDGIEMIESHNKVKHSSIGGNMNYIYGNTLVLGDSSYLEHHGIKNQKWGVRRFQNPDGSLTAAGRIRYGVTGAGKAVSKATKAVFNTGKTAGTKLVTSAKKAVAAKKEKDLAAKKEKVSKNRDSVLKNKDLFTSQELAELEKRFKVEDDMKFASMRKGQEIAKTISTYGDAAVKVLNAAQTGGKAVSAISAAMGSMDQLKENRDIRGKAAAEDMSFEDYKAYTKAKTEAKINKDFKNKNSTSSNDDDHDIPVVPVDYDDNPPPGGPGGGGSGGGPRTPTGGGPGGTDQNRVHRLTSDQQKKIVSFRTKKPKRDEDDVGDVSEEDVNKYKKASKDADSKAKSAQQNADNLKSKRDRLDAAIRNFKLPPVDNPNYDAAAAQLRAAHKQSADLQAAYKKAQSEADSARVAAYNAQREALASEYGGSKGKRIANDMAKKLSDKEYQHAVNAIDSQRESDKSGYDRNVAKAYLKDALNPKNIANRTIDKAAGKIADKAINKQKEALAKERDKQQKQMAENFQRSMKAGTLDASKGIRDYYQREFGLHGAQLDKAVNNYMDSHSGKGSKRTIDLSSYHDKRSSELAKKSASLSNREAAVSEREAVAGQREENIRVARQTLRAASDYLKGASEKVYNDSTIKEEQLHEINEHIRKMMGKRAAVHSEDNMLIENNTLIIGDTSSYLEHHGIPGQRWGVRRFQNKDGTRTAAGKKRYAEVGSFKFEDSTGRTQKRYYARIENNGRRQSGWDHIGTTKRQAKAEAAAEALADELKGYTPKLSDRDRKAYNADIKKAGKEIDAANRYAHREMAKNERWVKSAIPKANRTGNTSEFLRRAAKSQRDADYFNRYSIGDYKHEKSIERKSFAGEIAGSAVIGAGAGIASAISGPVGLGVAASGIAIRTGSVIVGNIAKNRYRDQSLRQNKTRQDEYYARDRLDKVRTEKAKKDTEEALRDLKEIERQEAKEALETGINDDGYRLTKEQRKYYKSVVKR